MSTLSSANVTDVNLVLKERTHMRLCLSMLIFTHNLGNWLIHVHLSVIMTATQCLVSNFRSFRVVRWYCCCWFWSVPSLTDRYHYAEGVRGGAVAPGGQLQGRHSDQAHYLFFNATFVFISSYLMSTSCSLGLRHTTLSLSADKITSKWRPTLTADNDGSCVVSGSLDCM